MCSQNPLSLACDLKDSFQWLCKGSSHFCGETTLSVFSALPTTPFHRALENPLEVRLVNVAAPWGLQEGRSRPSGRWTKDKDLLHPEQVPVESQKCPLLSGPRAHWGNFPKLPMKTRGFPSWEIRNLNDCTYFI